MKSMDGLTEMKKYKNSISYTKIFTISFSDYCIVGKFGELTLFEQLVKESLVN